MFQVQVNTKKHEEIENPLSVDEIEPRLFLGNVTAAVNLNFLKNNNITHILSIDSCSLPNYVRSNLNVVIKFIQISDMSRENILQYFDECFRFIDETLCDEKNAILIHCFYGVSRSSTVVIAYLMKKYQLSYEKALLRAKSKRKLVQPNYGFSQQCKLYHKMNYTIDPNFKNYKIFRLKLAAENVKSAKILPPNFMDLIKSDPGLIQENPEPLVYRCRKCRRVVASKSNLILHKVPKEAVDNSYESPSSRRRIKAESDQKYLNDLVGESSDQDAIIDITDKVLSASLTDEKSLSEDKGGDDQKTEFCSKYYFIEPLSWMKDVTNSTEGKLYCPTCKSKLGSFNWVMASKCSCGAQIYPSFYLVPSKIDFSNVVQNILQVTI